MENKKVKVKSLVNGRIRIFLPDLKLNVRWERKGQTRMIDFETLQEAVYDYGTEEVDKPKMEVVADIASPKDLKKRAVIDRGKGAPDKIDWAYLMDKDAVGKNGLSAAVENIINSRPTGRTDAEFSETTKAVSSEVSAIKPTYALSKVKSADKIHEYQMSVGDYSYVDDIDLAPIYSGADLFLYPSLYEGFGLPPLEAMQCGTPVITSNPSSLPEVVGDAGIMVDPTSVDAIAGAISQVLDDPDLRHELSEKGLLRAASFSWRKTAEIASRRFIEAFLEME